MTGSRAIPRLGGVSIDEIMAELIGKSLEEVEHRLHCCDLHTRLRRWGDEDNGEASGFDPERVNLTVTRQYKVISYTIG